MERSSLSGDILDRAKRLVSSSTVGGPLKSVSRRWRDAYGLEGFGCCILEGERARPLATSAEARWECFEVRSPPPGTSRTFSLRPVVGSTVYSTAGSWETWYPSRMYYSVRLGSSHYIK